MNFYPLYIPLAGMMVLTMLVWCYMYFTRLRYVLAKNINAERLKTPGKVSELLPDAINAPSNNLKNLFEMPVLFYITIIVASQIPDHSIVSNLAAWSFLFFRVLHSAIHCLNGKVMARFICYMLATIALFVLIINVFSHLFSA
ncbi:MAPEG family protein [Colwellia sp. MEBiC06753]